MQFSPVASLQIRAHAFAYGIALLVQAATVAAQDTGPVHDAPYIPSPQYVVDEMLRIAGVGPGDVVIDLGSGDGRVVIAAALRFGAQGVGIERDPALVARSRAGAVQAGVADRARFVQQDLFEADLAGATVVTMYLSPNLNLQLRPALLRLKPGTRIVSHASDLGDWKPDQRTTIRKDVMLWRVPAAIAGRWRAEFGPRASQLELAFTQRYQQVEAGARLDGKPAEVWQVQLQGDRLRFALIANHERADEPALYFDGRVDGSRIEGTAVQGAGASAGVQSWRARRIGP